MSSSDAVKLSPEQVQEILARLRPHLPSYLKKIELHPAGFGLRYDFAPFTGTEPQPEVPAAVRTDPGLTYVRESEDAAEHRLREAATEIICDLYDTARRQWMDAAYVRALTTALRGMHDLWDAYRQRAAALDRAYDYLRTPEATREWPAAITRVVDAQERAQAAAVAFDERARGVADVHEEHLYSDLSRNEGLTRAGYPQAKEWDIAAHDSYGRTHSAHDTYVPLAEKVRRLIERQDAHMAKVARLTGGPSPAASVPGPRRHG
ncbi:hypothetical protein ACWEPZ_29325 [Streptomyces sp. NPDC004288]